MAKKAKKRKRRSPRLSTDGRNAPMGEKRGICDHCGKRRMVAPCPCPVCRGGSQIQLCRQCERAELILCACGPDYTTTVAFESVATTTNMTVE